MRTRPRLVFLLAWMVMGGPLLMAEDGPSDKERLKALDRALENLASTPLTHPSGANGLSVTASTAGLAYIAAGTTPKKGKYKDQLIACKNTVLQVDIGGLLLNLDLNLLCRNRSFVRIQNLRVVR